MPLTKSAKKSLKVSRTRQAQNQKREILLEKALKSVNEKNVSQAISLIDKAAKTGIIHQNKAARLKSRLAKKFGTPAKRISGHKVKKLVKSKVKSKSSKKV